MGKSSMSYFTYSTKIPQFDHCDDRRHFQLVVPRRAQHCSIIRNALFAVSARHLSRLPQYVTPNGICYRGQLLPNLEKCTAVEYTLKCIPELLKFPEITDPTEQENIMVATVILRQYEEMEEDIEDHDMSTQDRVNFLAITQRIIDAMISHRLEQSLATAAYWIVIRQEVYYALTRQRAPKMRFSPEDWRKASVANTLVMLASEVTKWRWGDGTREEWSSSPPILLTYYASITRIANHLLPKTVSCSATANSNTTTVTTSHPSSKRKQIDPAANSSLQSGTAPTSK